MEPTQRPSSPPKKCNAHRPRNVVLSWREGRLRIRIPVPTVLILLSLTLSSCSHYFYTPVPHGDLVLEEKGDLKAAPSGGFTEITVEDEQREDRRLLRSHLGIQAAYSPIQGLGLLLSGQMVGDTYVGLVSEPAPVNQSTFVNLSVSHYTNNLARPGEAGRGNRITWENSLGLGFGSIRHQRPGGDGFNTTFTKFFPQSTMHWRIGKRFLAGGTVSPTFLWSRSIELASGSSESLREEVRNLERRDPLFYFETGVYFQLGWERFKFLWSIRSTLFSDVLLSSSALISHAPVRATFGVAFDLHRFFKPPSRNGDRGKF